MSDCMKCRYVSKEPYQEPCNRCKSNVSMLIDRFEPMTNADSIRAMSDEELAELFDKVIQDACTSAEYVGKCYTPYWLNKDTLIEWLQSEVKNKK